MDEIVYTNINFILFGYHSFEISPSINHEDSSSSQWRPVLSEYENVSPKRETKPKPQNTFISSSNRDSIRRDTIENQKLDKFEENALIQHLTDQIINLNQWRETAIMEAVEKDRYVYERIYVNNLCKSFSQFHVNMNLPIQTICVANMEKFYICEK